MTVLEKYKPLLDLIRAEGPKISHEVIAGLLFYTPQERVAGGGRGNSVAAGGRAAAHHG